ncbi:sigma-70 family RNA polymerase sigma factor [Oscillospiraceae bacterium PP1C4]
MLIFVFETEDECSKFNYLYIKYNKPLYYIALGIMSNSYLAQEAVQDTFVEISKVLDRLDIEQRSRSYAYLKTTLKRICYHKLAQEKKEKHPDISELEVPSNFQVEENLLKILDSELLKQLIKELKPEYQLPLIYKYYFDYSDMQIAKMLKITSVNVSVRLVRAKKKLLQRIEERGQLLNV